MYYQATTLGGISRVVHIFSPVLYPLVRGIPACSIRTSPIPLDLRLVQKRTLPGRGLTMRELELQSTIRHHLSSFFSHGILGNLVPQLSQSASRMPKIVVTRSVVVFILRPYQSKWSPFPCDSLYAVTCRPSIFSSAC